MLSHEEIYEKHWLAQKADPNKYHMQCVDSYNRRIREGKAILTLVQIEITRVCNFECALCARNDLPKELKRQSMSVEDFKNVLKKLPKTVNSIVLNGLGEAFFHPQFTEILHTAKRAKLKISLNSNGSNFTRNQLELIDSLYFSCDTISKDKVQSLRKNMKLDTFFTHLLNAIKARESFAPHLKVGICHVYSSENHTEIDNVMELAHELKIDTLYIAPPSNTYRFGSENFHNMENFLKKQHIVDWSAPLRAYRQRERPFELYIQYPRYQKGRCSWGHEMIFVDINSNLKACCLKIIDPELSFGNLKLQNFDEILNGKRFEDFVKSQMEGVSHRICDSCNNSCLYHIEE